MKKYAFVLATLSLLCAGWGWGGPSVSKVEKTFCNTFLCAFGCPVREVTATKMQDGSFVIDYVYRQCPYCNTDIKFADHPCQGHSPITKRGRATAKVDRSGKLRFFLNSGLEFDSWGVK